MKALKIVLGIVAVLAAVYVALAFAGPSHVSVQREAVIEAPVDVVFAEVNSLDRWTAWDPWQARDPQIVNTYTGPASGVGCRNEWRSEHKEVGNGSQEITESVENALIRTHLTFDGQGEADSAMEFEPQGDRTRVKWTMGMDIPFAGRPFMLFFNMEEAVGGDFEQGLASLGSHCRSIVEAMEAMEAAEEILEEEEEVTEG